MSNVNTKVESNDSISSNTDPNQKVDNIHINHNHNEVTMNTSKRSTTNENSEQKTIDINSIQLIDIAKCSNEDHDRIDFRSNEWKKLESAEESAIFRIAGLEKIQDEKLKAFISDNFYSQIKKHPRHKFIIGEQAMQNIWPNGVILDESAKNLWIEATIENDDQMQKFNKEHSYSEDMKIVKLKLPLQGLTTEFVDRLNWVVLELEESSPIEAIFQAHSVVQRCNSQNTPVWIYDAEVRTQILNSNQATVNATGALSKPVYFDLPIGTTPRLVNKSEETGSRVKKINEKITSQIKRFNKVELELGYHLTILDLIARKEGKSQFWKQHFDSNNRSEYCLEVLNIKPDLASQYITAIRIISILRPGLPTEVFGSAGDDKGVKSIPHGYTRYRDLKQYMPHIIALREHQDYENVIKMIFNPKESNRSLMRKLPILLAKLIGRPLPSSPVRAFDPVEYVTQFSDKLHNIVSEDQEIRFNELIDELKSILLSSSKAEPEVENIPGQGANSDDQNEAA